MEIRPEGVPRPEERPVILVIDDDAFTRLGLRNLLSRYQCEVVEAVNGLDGLRRIASQKIDLVLLDVRLPGMSGAEVLVEIRASPAHQAIPVVVISGASDKRLVSRCLQLGISEFIVKPLSREAVLRRLDPLMERLAKGQLQAEASHKLFRAPSGASKPVLVLADTDPNFRVFARGLLESRFEILETVTGIEAFDLISQRAPTIALLAEKLALISEVTVATLVKQQKAASTRVLLLTTNVARGSTNPVFDAVLTKSFVPDVFMEELRRARVFRDLLQARLAELLSAELRAELVTATRQSIGVLATLDVELSEEEAGPATGFDVKGSVDLRTPDGQGRLVVALGARRTLVEEFGSRMVGAEVTLADGALDALGELVSTIAGRLRDSINGRGITLDQQLPVTEWPSRAVDFDPAVALPFKTLSGEPFLVWLSIDD